MGIAGLINLLKPVLDPGYTEGTLVDHIAGLDGTSMQHNGVAPDLCRRPYVYRDDSRPAIRENIRLLKAVGRELGPSGKILLSFEGNLLPGKSATIKKRRTVESLMAAHATLQRRASYYSTSASRGAAADSAADEHKGEAPPLESEDPDQLIEWDTVPLESGGGGAEAEDDDVDEGWVYFDLHDVSDMGSGNPTDEEVKKAYTHLGERVNSFSFFLISLMILSARVCSCCLCMCLLLLLVSHCQATIRTLTTLPRLWRR